MNPESDPEYWNNILSVQFSKAVSSASAVKRSFREHGRIVFVGTDSLQIVFGGNTHSTLVDELNIQGEAPLKGSMSMLGGQLVWKGNFTNYFQRLGINDPTIRDKIEESIKAKIVSQLKGK